MKVWKILFFSTAQTLNVLQFTYIVYDIWLTKSKKIVSWWYGQNITERQSNSHSLDDIDRIPLGETLNHQEIRIS